ncbi:MAG TPA: L28 family ribosomal protein [Candidatus Paceibacterota bacterium]
MRICPITKKTSLIGGRYSNRTRATQFNPCGKIRRSANFQKKKIYIPELQKSISLILSAKGIKTLNKNGAYKTLKKAGVI